MPSMSRVAIASLAAGVAVAAPPALPRFLTGFNATHKDFLSFNQFKKSHPELIQRTAAHVGRMLADDHDCASTHIEEKIGFITYMAALPLMNMDTNAMVDVLCLTGNTDCDMKSSSTCNSGCEWNVFTNSCDTYAMIALEAMFSTPPAADSPYQVLIDEAKHCNTKTSTTCSEDSRCSWESVSYTCSPSDDVYMKLTCDNSAGADAVHIMHECSMRSMTDCEDDSQCFYDLFECGIAPAVFNAKAYGDAAGSALMADIAQVAVCLASAVMGCDAEGCEISVSGCSPTLSDRTNDMMDLAVACALKNEDSCTGDCEYDMGCTPTTAAGLALCGPEAGTTSDGMRAHLAWVLAPVLAGMLLKA